ncbi:MAG: sigma-70 family RNA polymerase sigma factor, partial [Lysinibacillus sp.]
NRFYDLFTRSSPEMKMIKKNEKTALAIHIFRLKPQYREVIVLYYYEDLSVKEIAGLLSCSENTVKTRLSRARQQLKERIGGVGK